MGWDRFGLVIELQAPAGVLAIELHLEDFLTLILIGILRIIVQSLLF